MLIASAGCGSRKVEVKKVVSDISEVKQFASVDSTKISNNAVFNSDSYIIEPIDNSIPMVIDNRNYSNVRIKKERVSSVSESVEKKGVSKKGSIQAKKEESSEIKISDRKGIDIFSKIAIIIIAITIIVYAGKIAFK